MKHGRAASTSIEAVFTAEPYKNQEDSSKKILFPKCVILIVVMIVIDI